MSPINFRTIKPEIRVVGIDDGLFIPHTKGYTTVIGVVFRGGYWIDGAMSTRVKIDGLDATKKIADMITTSPHYKQLRVVMINGVTFAGFNVVDIKQLNAATKLPVIAVTRDKPNLKEIHEALRNLTSYNERWKAIENAGKILEVITRNKNEKIYVEFAGILEDDARKILRITSTRSNIPEPLRVAHLIASGITSLSSNTY